MAAATPRSVPAPTVVQAYRFALDPTPAQARTMAMFAGASRFAYNRMLAEVKATLDARHWERVLLGGCLTPAQGWSLAALRRTWNANKDVWAPWWREVSKEAFNHGLEALSAGLNNWSEGTKTGRRVGFPRYKRRGGRASFAYTTGSIRVCDDRRSVQLPRLGRVRTHESTRRLQRRLSAGTARVLRATVSCDSAGRWHVAFTVEVQRAVQRGSHTRHERVGVDVGVRDLLVAASADGREVVRVGAPRPLRDAQRRLARLQRKAARQTRGSRRRAVTVRRIGRTHARAAAVRRDTLHKATTRLAKMAETIVVEDLHVAGMGRTKNGLGARGRGFNRALADSGMAEVRRLLGYKTVWYGSQLLVADRWWPSSKTCSGCGARKPSLHLHERTYRCESCGLAVDRDLNAAVNLARWPDQADVPPPRSGREGANYGRGAEREPDPAQAGDVAGRETSTHQRPDRITVGPPPRKRWLCEKMTHTFSCNGDNNMTRITAVLAALLLAVLPGCAQASAQERIAQASTVTQDEQSALMSMEMVMTGGQQDVTVTAEGGVDFANQRSTITINMGEQAAAGGFGEMRLVTDGTTVYMELPNAEEMGLPTPWVKMDLEAMSGMQGLGDMQQFGNDPSKSMEMLRGVSDDVTEVGSEEVRGEPTTHYQATIDLDKALEQMPEDARPFVQQQLDLLGTTTLPVEVWIDEAGRLRRQRIDMDLSAMAESTPGAPTNISTTVEMFDFGATVDAQPPPADEVTDFADMQGLGG